MSSVVIDQSSRYANLFHANLLGHFVFRYLEQKITTSDYQAIRNELEIGARQDLFNLKREFSFETFARLKQCLEARFGAKQAAKMSYEIGDTPHGLKPGGFLGQPA